MKKAWKVVKFILIMVAIMIVFPVLGEFLKGGLRGALGLPADGKH